MSLLLALANKTPNAEAIAIAPTMGWLLFGAALAVAVLFVAYADHWRHWWLKMEDPRGIAVFRIVFGVFVVSNINGMWEYFEFLYTDEGIFPTAVAREVFARQEFIGFGDGGAEPWGFFDAVALWQFVRGPKWSLLFFWDSPQFFWAHLAAFEVAGLCLIIGFRTRLAAVLTWFLMNSILTRNSLAWEGTEMVYRCFLAYLVLARSGHAYSVDNWLRCRKLRKQGRLSERGGPGAGAGLDPSDEYPRGLEAVYRLIPSWPRKLIMLQLATIYITTGTLKTGGVWLAGDSLYYALNLDHFYRLPPQFLSSLIGTNVMRAMTWAVKVGQSGFPLLILGLVARSAIAGRIPAPKGPWSHVAKVALASVIALSGAVIYVAWPVHYTPNVDRRIFVSLWIALWLGVWLLWRKLGAAPFAMRRVLGRELRRPVVIDRLWVCRWVLGRRIWLLWHVAFHAHIFTLMSVGQFQTGMLSATFAFLEGREIATMLRDVGHRLAQWHVPRIPGWVCRGEPILPGQNPELTAVQKNPTVLPSWLLLGGLGAVVGGVLVRVWVAPAWDFRWVWLATVAVVVAVGVVRVRKYKSSARHPAPTMAGRLAMPWAYGPVGRTIVSAGIAWHLSAVSTSLLPDKDCLKSFRAPAQRVFSTWLARTTTSQSWGMFAPNPPRANVFMKVLVTDANGEVFDLKSDVYAEERKPIPWIWNTRLRKMNRRIIGGESGPTDWYRKWYARYECRRWALDHGGEAPAKVELVKLSYRIPPPESVATRGYYIAEDLLERAGEERVLYTENCATAVLGQLSNEIRARHGLPLLEPGVEHPWVKRRKHSWERRRKAALSQKQ